MEFFVITAPGLEAIAAAELDGLGMKGRPIQGGVEVEGDASAVYRCCLHLRTASRVVVRVGRFRARSFIELERHLKRIDWSPYIAPGGGVQVRASSGKSKLYHEGAIAERVGRRLVEVGAAKAELASRADEVDADSTESATAAAADDAAASPAAGRANDESANRPPGAADQLVIVRFHRDECVVSVDASGDLLHRRGYRQAVAKAPLRETLAAAMLLGSGWRPGIPLLDPFCGSGTLLIEAALMARRIPPGLAGAEREPRPFAFERWPGFDPALWQAIVGEAKEGILPAAGFPLRGSDRDAGAVAAARANAERAGVAEDLELAVAAFSSLDCGGAPGWIITNPPYGVRVGEKGPLRNLYSAIGSAARDRCAGWSIAMLNADPELARRTGLEWRETFRTSNGGIPVRLLTSEGSPEGAELPSTPVELHR